MSNLYRTSMNNAPIPPLTEEKKKVIQEKLQKLDALDVYEMLVGEPPVSKK